MLIGLFLQHVYLVIVFHLGNGEVPLSVSTLRLLVCHLFFPPSSLFVLLSGRRPPTSPRPGMNNTDRDRCAHTSNNRNVEEGQRTLHSHLSEKKRPVIVTAVLSKQK